MIPIDVVFISWTDGFPSHPCCHSKDSKIWENPEELNTRINECLWGSFVIPLQSII